MVGSVITAVAATLGFAFLIPALGWNPYGRNPPAVTIVALFVAADLCVLGVGLQFWGGRLMARFRGIRDAAWFGLIGLCVTPFLVNAAVHGWWDDAAFLLCLAIIVGAPLTFGALWLPSKVDHEKCCFGLLPGADFMKRARI